MYAAVGGHGAEDADPFGAAASARVNRGLSRRQRIADSAIFREAFDQGRKQAGRLMVMWLRRGEGASLRLGVVTSRRQFRRAVDRTRARRLMREAYRLNRHRFCGEFDVVLVARQAMLAASRQDAERDLLRIAGRAGLMRGGKGWGGA